MGGPLLDTLVSSNGTGSSWLLEPVKFPEPEVRVQPETARAWQPVKRDCDSSCFLRYSIQACVTRGGAVRPAFRLPPGRPDGPQTGWLRFDPHYAAGARINAVDCDIETAVAADRNS